MRSRLTIWLLLGFAAILFAPAVALAETYGDYSMMFQKRGFRWGATYGEDNQAAFAPILANFSTGIHYYRNGSANPANYHEYFQKSANGLWIDLDGYQEDPGPYLVQRVSSMEKATWTGSACTSWASVAVDNPPREHYALWQIPVTGYCLRSYGEIYNPSSGPGTGTLFFHMMVYFTGTESCSNSWYSGQTCIRVWDSWWDECHSSGDCPGGTPGVTLVRRAEKTVWLARGIGPVFKYQEEYPGNWSAGIYSYWNWQ
jgi:hypothetical protein